MNSLAGTPSSVQVTNLTTGRVVTVELQPLPSARFVFGMRDAVSGQAVSSITVSGQDAGLITNLLR